MRLRARQNPVPVENILMLINSHPQESGKPKITTSDQKNESGSHDQRPVYLGHFFLTDSLGKYLDQSKLGKGESVTMKAISGGHITDGQRLFAKTKYQNKSVSILLGTNDISDGMHVEECTQEYTKLVTGILDTQKNAKIFLFEIPPRIRPNMEQKNAERCELNQQIKALAETHERLTFVQTGINMHPKFYMDDGVHVHVRSGYGIPGKSIHY